MGEAESQATFRGRGLGHFLVAAVIGQLVPVVYALPVLVALAVTHREVLPAQVVGISLGALVWGFAGFIVGRNAPENRWLYIAGLATAPPINASFGAVRASGSAVVVVLVGAVLFEAALVLGFALGRRALSARSASAPA